MKWMLNVEEEYLIVLYLKTDVTFDKISRGF